MNAEADMTVTGSLIPVSPPPAAHLDDLCDQLVKRADGAGLLDVAYRFVDTPVGAVLLAATPVGLVRVAYPNEDFSVVLEAIGQRISPRILHSPARLDPAARQLEEYFGGVRRGFDLALDLRLTRGFRSQVVRYLLTIAYGTTATYGEVAVAVNRPGAARAVGTACATNPLPLFIPCHRVIRADGRIGAYLGGDETKRWLLEMEGVPAPQRESNL